MRHADFQDDKFEGRAAEELENLARKPRHAVVYLATWVFGLARRHVACGVHARSEVFAEMALNMRSL